MFNDHDDDDGFTHIHVFTQNRQFHDGKFGADCVRFFFYRIRTNVMQINAQSSSFHNSKAEENIFYRNKNEIQINKQKHMLLYPIQCVFKRK